MPTDPAQDALLARLVASLADDPAYEVLGALDTTPWGSGQWVRYTDAEGREHYLRIVVEPPPVE